MAENLILKQFDSEVKIVEGERALNVTITTNDVDRYGDIVEPKGAKLTNFKKNPVVLMSHDYTGLPIGKAKDLVKSDTGITAKVIFPEEGTYPLADTVYNMYKQKFMTAWSIGFSPIKSEDITDDDNDSKAFKGRRYKTWELLEFSACAVPCNPNALTNMLSKGIDIGILKEEGIINIKEDEDIEKVIDDEIHKDKLEPEPIDPGKFKASMEDDDKELQMDIFKIYEIINENKKLKEKIKDIELKAGAVLNAKNKSNLKNAQNLIQSVLDSAGTEEAIDDDKSDDIKEVEKNDTVITIKNGPGKDEAKDKEKKEVTYNIDENLIKESVKTALNKHLGKR